MQGLNDQLEREARQRSAELEAAGKLPDGFTAQHYPLTRAERIDLRRLSVAWRLAPDLDTLHDLLLGVPVDPAHLNTKDLDEAHKASLVQLVPPINVLERSVP